MEAEDRWRGVNLGGWLVIEKWITPSLFTGIKAVDEYGLCMELGKDAASILTFHRDHFITEDDFAWLAAHGLNAIRLPIGHWIFGRAKPYVGGIEYVDRTMDWAEKYGLAVVLDLHGAPGSQNGRDHSGRAGTVGWHRDDNMEKTLQLLERLAKRYAGMPALAGIELLNEPALRRLGKRRLARFYEEAYRRIRQHCGAEVAIIFPDGFKPHRWGQVLRGEAFQRIVLDVHTYQLFGWRDKRRPYQAQLRLAQRRARLIARLQRSHGVIIGEWSLALPPPVVDTARSSLPGVPQRAYAAVQLLAMDRAKGWFFWTYRTENGGVWSYRDSVRRGWLPRSVAPLK